LPGLAGYRLDVFEPRLGHRLPGDDRDRGGRTYAGGTQPGMSCGGRRPHHLSHRCLGHGGLAGGDPPVSGGGTPHPKNRLADHRGRPSFFDGHRGRRQALPRPAELAGADVLRGSHGVSDAEPSTINPRSEPGKPTATAAG
ncbi:MAG: hypothetical protein ACK56I_14850, partial [bacterium]